MKRYDNEQQETLRAFHQPTADRAVVWIDDGTGRIIDELEVETRIRPGTGGCQLCREPLDGSQKLAALEFDDRGLPRLLFGVGEPVCIDCVEWVRWLQHYAGREPLSKPRFAEGAVVLRTGTEELYQVTHAKLTGLPAAGVWFPVYTCRRIEVRKSTGEILPACLGLEFELADFELQPVPPRYAVTVPGNEPIDGVVAVTDLVGAPLRLPPIAEPVSEGRAPRLSVAPRLLLPTKGGNS